MLKILTIGPLMIISALSAVAGIFLVAGNCAHGNDPAGQHDWMMVASMVAFGVSGASYFAMEMLADYLESRT